MESLPTKQSSWNRTQVLGTTDLALFSLIIWSVQDSALLLPQGYPETKMVLLIISLWQKSLIGLDPEFKSRPVYITGESYAGKYVPAIGYHILKKNYRQLEPERVNLAGVAIGKGLTDPVVQVTTHADNAYLSDLINEKQKTQLEVAQTESVKLVQSKNWSKATGTRNALLRLLHNMTGLATLYNMRRKTPYEVSLVARLLSNMESKRALRVNASFDWEECSDTAHAALHADVMKSVKNTVELLVKESKVMLYQGHLDLRWRRFCGSLDEEAEMDRNQELSIC